MKQSSSSRPLPQSRVPSHTRHAATHSAGPNTEPEQKKEVSSGQPQSASSAAPAQST